MQTYLVVSIGKAFVPYLWAEFVSSLHLATISKESLNATAALIINFKNI